MEIFENIDDIDQWKCDDLTDFFIFFENVRIADICSKSSPIRETSMAMTHELPCVGEECLEEDMDCL